MVSSDSFDQLRATASRGLDRELAARRRVRALRAELHAARLEAVRATAALGARTDRLDEALARQDELVRELSETRASLRRFEQGQLEASRALAARDERLREAHARIAELEEQRRTQYRRAFELQSSRTYRLMRRSWRVRAALRRPWRLLRRG